MKAIPQTTASRAFTLVELLVVISIIAVLASLILPALSQAKGKARIAEARTEMRQIVNAISTYKADYKRVPTGRGGVGDVTFGLTGTGTTGPAAANGAANNSEIIAALADLLVFRDGTTTTNVNHQMNPRRNDYLDYKDSQGNATSPAPDVGLDGVYRDPWGTPYIITLDANYDGACHDTFYRREAVSGSGVGVTGLVGTFRGTNLPNPPAAPNNFVIRAEATVWSFGPDRTANAGAGALDTANADNILSWFSK